MQLALYRRALGWSASCIALIWLASSIRGYLLSSVMEFHGPVASQCDLATCGMTSAYLERKIPKESGGSSILLLDTLNRVEDGKRWSNGSARASIDDRGTEKGSVAILEGTISIE